MLNWVQHICKIKIPIRKYELELYFQEILNLAINKAIHFERMNKYQDAIEALNASENLFKEMKKSKSVETLHICSRYVLCFGIIYMESSQIQNAHDKLIEGMECIMHEINLILNHLDRFSNTFISSKRGYQLYRSMLLISITIYNMGIMNLMSRNYIETLECYTMCKWIDKILHLIFNNEYKMKMQQFIINLIRLNEEEINIIIKMERKIEDAPTLSKRTIDEKINNDINITWKRSEGSIGKDKQIRKAMFNCIMDRVYKDNICRNSTKLKFITKTASAKTFKTANQSKELYKTAKLPISISNTKKRFKRNYLTYKNDNITFNSDEYFKNKICSDFKMNLKWLHEKTRKKRIGQDNLEKIINNENKNVKSLNILKDFLMIKRKKIEHKRFKETDLMKSSREAFYDVSHKMCDIKKDLNNQSAKYSIRHAKSINSNIIKRNASLKTKPTESPQTRIN